MAAASRSGSSRSADRRCAKKGNYRIPIGTPVRFALETCGAGGGRQRVFLGGPMMGPAVSNLDIPITKGTSGITALSPRHETGPLRHAELSLYPLRALRGCLPAVSQSVAAGAAGQDRRNTSAWPMNFTCSIVSNAAPVPMCARRIFRWCSTFGWPRTWCANCGRHHERAWQNPGNRILAAHCQRCQRRCHHAQRGTGAAAGGRFAVYAFGLAALLVLLTAVLGLCRYRVPAVRPRGRASTVSDWSVTITGLALRSDAAAGLPLWMVVVRRRLRRRHGQVPVRRARV